MAVIESVRIAGDLAAVRGLMEEYAAILGVDLRFQHFDEELATLPGAYAPPAGCLLLAWEGEIAVGCVGIRPLESSTAEMKRLYVRPGLRSRGLGRMLAERAIAQAQSAGYRRIRLDTLASMTQAHALYRSLGFVSIPAYRHNPIPGTVFFELELTHAPDRGRP